MVSYQTHYLNIVTILRRLFGTKILHSTELLYFELLIGIGDVGRYLRRRPILKVLNEKFLQGFAKPQNLSL